MTNNENKQPECKERKDLTPQQRQARKKMVIFPLFFIAFAGCMWLIFAPNSEPEQQISGYNTNLPTPEQSGIVEDKRDAYIQEEMKQKQQDKMRSLQDFAFELDDDEMQDEPEPQVTFGNSSRRGNSNNAFTKSADAYANINRQLGTFYTDTSSEDEKRQSEMQERIEELERRLQEEEERKTAQDEQVALLEKSYEIAARYMNGGKAPAQEVATVQTATSGKAVVQPVKQVRPNVVSLLAAPMPDSVFKTEFVKPRNWGFNTICGEAPDAERNGIRAAVYRTVTITDGGQVALRLQEAMRAGDFLIPQGTVVTGAGRIAGERLGITVSAVQYAGTVVPIELLVYDMDGNEGISVPGSEEINAVKEIAANMGSGMGSSITITDDAGSQLLSDLGRSAIQGVSSYVSKKMRTVKVTLKADYEVLLLPPQK